MDDLVYQHKAKREILIGSILRTEDFSGRLLKVLRSLRVRVFWMSKTNKYILACGSSINRNSL